MINYRDHIQSDFQIMLGKPIIKGTRITVELIIRKLSEGATPSDILDMYPLLKLDDIRACLIYAADVIAKEEVVELVKAS